MASGDVRLAAQLLSQDGGAPARLPACSPPCAAARSVVVPRSLNQRAYLEKIAKHDMVFGIGPGGHRQDLPGGGAGGRRASSTSRSRASCSRGRRSRPARSSASCRATCRRRSTPTCGRSTTRSTTCSTTRRWRGCWSATQIEVAPIAFMRGRTLNDAFVIIDEAQNTTTEQMKMVLTRIGFGSKVVVTGDITQIDLPRGRCRAWSRRSPCSPAPRASRSATSTRRTWCGTGWYRRSIKAYEALRRRADAGR